MDVDSDQQTREPTPEPSFYNDLTDCYMRDDYDSEPETDADPQDYDETFHFLILTKLPPITSYPWSQAASGLYRGSSWDDIIGDEMSESERYWRDLQSPQSKPPRQGSEVCSSPTSSPHRPNMAPQPGNYVSMRVANSGMDNTPCTHETYCKHRAPPPSICDHVNCYPPPEVGFLDRRFEENGDWLRGRALAVSSLVYKRSGIYSLPIEIMEMVVDCFPIIDPLTSGLEVHKSPLKSWNRHRAFAVLSATCIRLKALFWHRSWRTRIVTPRALSATATLFKEVGARVQAHLIETLITRLPDDPTKLCDCLTALPSLHTLWVIDNAWTGTGVIGAAFPKTKAHFPSIRRAVIPICAHPLLLRLPNLEELACHRNPNKHPAMKSIVGSLRGPHMKSLSVIAEYLEADFAKALVKKFPKLRKLCLPIPSEEDMGHLHGLKEIVELEILVQRRHGQTPAPYNIKPIETSAKAILQASECHKDCRCGQKCGCATTNDCQECNPPKRFLRIKETFTGAWDGVCRLTVDDKPCVETQVSSRGVLSTI